MRRLLEGIRVIEWASHHAGPGGPALLGDLGAEVIKIEERLVGSADRQYLGIGSYSFELPGGRSAMFELSNRNKKSVTIELSKPEGQELAYRLIEKADVFLTNHRRSAVIKRGLDYETVRQRNPRLIYAHISAFGRNGPDANEGGFDFQGQARSGLMTTVGPPDLPLGLVHLGPIDQMTAFTASYAVIAALLARERYGVGQEVHASLLGSAICLLHLNVVGTYLLGHEPPKHDRLNPGNPLRNYYRCQDNKWLIVTHGPSQPHWPGFCEALAIPELISDPRFDSDASRGEHARALVAILDGVFATKPRDEWLSIARQAMLNMGPVNSVSDLAGDPQVLANSYLVDFDFPGLGQVKMPGFPVQFSETPARIESAAPSLGEHTDDVLGDLLGLSATELDGLRNREII